jgi:hypothetical protein
MFSHSVFSGRLLGPRLPLSSYLFNICILPKYFKALSFAKLIANQVSTIKRCLSTPVQLDMFLSQVPWMPSAFEVRFDLLKR